MNVILSPDDSDQLREQLASELADQVVTTDPDIARATEGFTPEQMAEVREAAQAAALCAAARFSGCWAGLTWCVECGDIGEGDTMHYSADGQVANASGESTTWSFDPARWRYMQIDRPGPDGEGREFTPVVLHIEAVTNYSAEGARALARFLFTRADEMDQMYRQTK